MFFFPVSLEYDIPVFEKSGKGGTYPRRYGIPFGLQDYSDGLYRRPDSETRLWFLCVTPVLPSNREEDLPSGSENPGSRVPIAGQLQPDRTVPQYQQRQQRLHP